MVRGDWRKEFPRDPGQRDPGRTGRGQGQAPETGSRPIWQQHATIIVGRGRLPGLQGDLWKFNTVCMELTEKQYQKLFRDTKYEQKNL